MFHLAGVKYNQSESEVRLNNLELKVELIISEFNKMINAPRVRPVGKQRELSPSI